MSTPLLRALGLSCLYINGFFALAQRTDARPASSWDRLHPSVMKAVESVDLRGNPFRSLQGVSGQDSASAKLREGPYARIHEALCEAVRGHFPGTADACVLIGTRIYHLGQELFLSDYSWGEKSPGILRLRQVEASHLVFVCDERLRKLCGQDEWIVPVQGKRGRQ